MFEHIVAVLFPMVAIVTLGYFLGRGRHPDMSDANGLNLDVFTPALIFTALASRPLDLPTYLPLTIGTLLTIAGSGAIAWVVSRLTGTDPRTLVPAMAFNNSGNLGLPVAVLAFGEQALAPMAIMMVLSNFLHFSLGTWYLNPGATPWRALLTPVVIAAALGAGAGVSGIALWPPLALAIRMVGDICIPLMLLSLGVRLATTRVSSVGFGMMGAVLRPASGMLIAWASLFVLPLPPEQRSLLVVFGALPPAVLNFLFAERYGQEPERVAALVLIGNVMSLVFLPLALILTA